MSNVSFTSPSTTATYTYQSDTRLQITVAEDTVDHKKLKTLIADYNIKPSNPDDGPFTIILSLDDKEYSLIDIFEAIASPVAQLSLQVMAIVLQKLQKIENRLGDK